MQSRSPDKGVCVALVVDMPNEPSIFAGFRTNVLFTNKERLSVWCLV